MCDFFNCESVQISENIRSLSITPIESVCTPIGAYVVFYSIDLRWRKPNLLSLIFGISQKPLVDPHQCGSIRIYFACNTLEKEQRRKKCLTNTANRSYASGFLDKALYNRIPMSFKTTQLLDFQINFNMIDLLFF